MRLNPEFPIPYDILMFTYIALNRLDEAKAAHEQALERKVGGHSIHIALYEIALLLNDDTGMAQQLESLADVARNRGRAAGVGSRYRGLFRATSGCPRFFPPGDGFR